MTLNTDKRLTEAQRDLADYMSKISEEAYAAGWILGWEFELWDVCIHGPRLVGNLEIEQEHIDKLLSLSSRCDGWIKWDENHGCTFAGFEDFRHLFAVCSECLAFINRRRTREK
jgi:hypothetical protein